MSAEPTWPRVNDRKIEVDRWALDVLFHHINVVGYGEGDGYIDADADAVAAAQGLVAEALIATDVSPTPRADGDAAQ